MSMNLYLIRSQIPLIHKYIWASSPINVLIAFEKQSMVDTTKIALEILYVTNKVDIIEGY